MKALSNIFSVFIIITLLVLAMQGKREERKAVEINERELACLVHNIVLEASNQPDIGQAAVAWVTLNRVRSPHYPDTICKVVWQKNYKNGKWTPMFSWTLDGKPDTVTDMKAVQKAVDIALAVVRGRIPDPSGGALHFYNPKLARPAWAKKASWFINIGDHRFVELARH